MKKNNITIEQKSLFGDKSNSLSTAFSSKASSNYTSTPALNLLAGIDKTTLKSDGVYWLRILSNQYSRGFPSVQAKRNLAKTIQAEIGIKKGNIPTELAVMDALLRRHINKF